jgi:ATP-binding cassette subfamily F protein 3
MLSLDQLGLDFGGRTLFDDASLRINGGDRIGLVGRNGMGKSTLLRVIANQQMPSRGSVAKQKNLKIGYFNQDLLAFESDRSLFEVVATAYGNAYDYLLELEALYSKTTDFTEAETDRMYFLQDEVSRLDAYRIESEVKKTLVGLGFTDQEMEKVYRQFSGGWRMRAMLAKCLLERPDLLMLDEPTNHLDLPAIQWLEQFIARYEGAVMIVSHDKAFLDGSCNRIWELDRQRITDYTGNYSKFEITKAERLELLISQAKNQEAWMKEQMRFVERFRSKASKARAVQSRLKLLDKVDRIEVEEGGNRTLAFKPVAVERAGKEVVRLQKIKKSFAEKVIFTGADGVLERGDKVALIGPNGQGKSTLLKVISGAHDYDGEVVLGHNVRYSFYAQHQLDVLDAKNTIWDEVTRGTLYSDQEKRNLLGAFLFGGDDIDKRVSVLSGGERARVAMAIVMAQGANFLMLDEPTNHLDIPSVEQLGEALQAYNGSYLVVSHDREFLRDVSNKVWYLEDGKVRVFDGGYAEFEEVFGSDFWATKSKNSEKNADKNPANQTTESSKNATNSKKENNMPSKNQSNIKDIELTISNLESHITTLEMEMAKASENGDINIINELNCQYVAAKSQLEIHYQEWERNMA